MIEQTLINGEPATVVYLKGNMVPATKEDHTFVKVIFPDGRQMFAQPSTNVAKIRQRIRKLKEQIAKYSPDEPRDHGKWTNRRQHYRYPIRWPI
jgi:hypothetical protein